MAHWNFCFSSARRSFFYIAFVYAWLGAGGLARATQIQALYTAACQRQVGIILDVTPREIKLLNLDGKIVSIKRFEVIYYATFLIDTVPISEVKNPGAVPMLEIKTLEGDELVKLVRGWPVNFGKDKIAVLNDHGTEILIDRSSIWRLDFDDNQTGFQFRTRSTTHYRFEHPYAFASCPHTDSLRKSSVFTVYPQQLLNDPISIKRELDRFAEGHAQIHQYDRDQDFYARPEVYTNETLLGLWLTGGSRYGSSHARASNFTPYLVNRFSAGPFGFQSEFKTGAGPIAQSVHEETQTQVYYRLKADYFHFSGMVDPNLLLVGDKYKWARSELDANDVRANESAFLEFGFDYGRFSLEVFPGGVMNFGAESEGRFRANTGNLTRVGLRWQGFHWMANLIAGSGSHSDSGTFAVEPLRVNVEWSPGASQRYEFSFFRRRLTVQSNDDSTSKPFQVEGTALTGAAYAHYRFKKRYWAGVLLALESLDLRSGYDSYAQASHKLYPKAGALISLSF